MKERSILIRITGLILTMALGLTAYGTLQMESYVQVHIAA